MSLSLSYDAANARVVVTGASLGAGPVTVQRSVDEVVWQTVRGGVNVELDSGGFTLHDYEFVDGVPNHYRVVDPAEADSITPDLDGQIWLKHPMFVFLNRPVAVTQYGGIVRASRAGVFEVKGRSWPVAVHDVRASRQFELEIMTDGLEAERFMDLTLAASGPLFVHIPKDCPVPGGYVTVGDAGQERRSTRGTRRYFTLPCRVTAPPAPSIHGGTMTYAGVLALFGDYDGLELDVATYQALLELVGDPNDLVVT